MERQPHCCSCHSWLKTNILSVQLWSFSLEISINFRSFFFFKQLNFKAYFDKQPFGDGEKCLCFQTNHVSLLCVAFELSSCSPDHALSFPSHTNYVAHFSKIDQWPTFAGLYVTAPILCQLTPLLLNLAQFRICKRNIQCVIYRWRWQPYDIFNNTYINKRQG